MSRSATKPTLVNVALQVKRPHCSGVDHANTLLNEVKDKVLLGLWTCRVGC